MRVIFRKVNLEDMLGVAGRRKIFCEGFRLNAPPGALSQEGMKRSPFFHHCFGIGILALGVALLAGCDQPQARTAIPETEETLYKDAQLLRETDSVAAREKFLQVISARGSDNAPESHLELGRIYLDRQQAVEAIYHFSQYVRLRPNSAQAGQAKDLINTAHKIFLQNLPGQPYSGNVNRDDLLQRLRAENDALKVKNAELQNRISQLERGNSSLLAAQREAPISSAVTVDPQALAPAQPPPPPPPTTTQQVPATYTVQQGDSLYRISLKVYGSHGRWQEIYRANQHQMSSANDLKVGMVLNLPR